MLRFQIPDVVWGAVFGIFVTIVFVGSTLKYLPPPLKMMFGDDATDCRQPTIYSDEKAKSGKEGAKDNTAILQDTEPGDHENEPEGKKREYECLIAKYTGSLAAFTRWLVVATLLLALFGFWQLMVSRKTAKRQLRAYVLVNFARVLDFGIEHPPSVEIIVKNSGQTPAFDLVAWMGIEIADFPLNIELASPQPDLKKSRSALAAGDITRTSRPLAVRPFTELETNMITSGGKAIYVFGEIKYKDIFKTEWSTHFRMMYGGGGGVAPDGALTFCEEGNEAK